jgi:hypothetical protein
MYVVVQHHIKNPETSRTPRPRSRADSGSSQARVPLNKSKSCSSCRAWT